MKTKDSCQKVSFNSSKDAQTKANSINKSNSQTFKQKQKMRAYQCKECGFWHLTSWSSHKFKVINNRDFRETYKRKVFIERETEYWQKKLKVL